MPYVLEPRTRAFAFAILGFVATLPPTTQGRVVAWQLGRAGTSVGANYRRAARAQSDRDFIAKLKVVEEEADECGFWLDACREHALGDSEMVARLRLECAEITAMTVAAIRTMRNRQTDRKK